MLVAATVSCGGTSAPPVEFGKGLPNAPLSPEQRSLESQMFERVNRDRKGHGLAPLVFDPKLSDIARSHSADMRDNGFFSHESPRFGALDSRLHLAGYLFVKSRENLAEAPTVNDAEDGLLASPHHYENLTAQDITHIGVGIVLGGVKDARNLTVTQIFSTPARHEGDQEATSTIVRAIQEARRIGKLGPIPRSERLERLAREQLAMLKDDLDASQLSEVSRRVAASLAQAPIQGTRGIGIAGQVVVDSTQFLVEGSALDASAGSYGIAVDHRSVPSTAGRAAPRLRVLLLVGLR